MTEISNETLTLLLEAPSGNVLSERSPLEVTQAALNLSSQLSKKLAAVVTARDAVSVELVMSVREMGPAVAKLISEHPHLASTVVVKKHGGEELYALSDDGCKEKVWVREDGEVLVARESIVDQHDGMVEGGSVVAGLGFLMGFFFNLDSPIQAFGFLSLGLATGMAAWWAARPRLYSGMSQEGQKLIPLVIQLRILRATIERAHAVLSEELAAAEEKLSSLRIPGTPL